jgi:RNA polymerase sigma-70 factor (ECF subfamily)
MNGAHSDFARVYDEHIWGVYGFLAYRLPDRETAEDLTQATFERALRAWSRFDPRRASERTWLLTIARNLLIDHHRQSRSDPVESIDERLLPAQPGPEARAGGSPELVAALASLGEREREVLALRFGADLAGPEIAQVLSLSLANVQQIISRSLRKLRTLLGEGGADGAGLRGAAGGAGGRRDPAGMPGSGTRRVFAIALRR